MEEKKNKCKALDTPNNEKNTHSTHINTYSEIHLTNTINQTSLLLSFYLQTLPLLMHL